MKRKLRSGVSASLLVVAACVALHSPYSLAARDAQTILKETCQGCHTPEADNALSRISHQRKTPEGWLMSIARMQTMHGLQISDDDRRTLVKYLADTQGLAPSETDGVRYALERRLNTVEKFDDQTSQMCGRCHSGARVALQRRPAQEWERLVNFHLGQWPSLEYQALARDRDWFDLARKDMVPLLAKRYPLDNPAWKKWLNTAPKAEALVGDWSFSGHLPGKGELAGVMSVSADGSDTFKVSVRGQYADGSPFNGHHRYLARSRLFLGRPDPAPGLAFQRRRNHPNPARVDVPGIDQRRFAPDPEHRHQTGRAHRDQHRGAQRQHRLQFELHLLLQERLG